MMQTLIVTLGGLATAVVGGSWWANWHLRRNERNTADFHLSKELMEEIRDKTREIRRRNEVELELRNRIYELELELFTVECRRKSCAYRRPRKPFTPAAGAGNMPCDEYFAACTEEVDTAKIRHACDEDMTPTEGRDKGKDYGEA